MTASDVRLVVQEALERTGADPQLVTDNGSQFTAKDFKQMVRLFELEHIRIRTYHPESNGMIERFHRSTREELAEVDLTNLGRPRELIARWVAHYNGERLHAALHYLPPVEDYQGAPEARIAERKDKLARARKRWERINRERLQAAASWSEKCGIEKWSGCRKGFEALHQLHPRLLPCFPSLPESVAGKGNDLRRIDDSLWQGAECAPDCPGEVVGSRGV